MSRRKKNKGRKQPERCERGSLEVTLDMADVELVDAFGEELAETMLGLGVSLEGIMDAYQFAERHVTNKRDMMGDLIAAGDVLHAYVQKLAKLSDALHDAKTQGVGAVRKAA